MPGSLPSGSGREVQRWTDAWTLFVCTARHADEGSNAGSGETRYGWVRSGLTDIGIQDDVVVPTTMKRACVIS